MTYTNSVRLAKVDGIDPVNCEYDMSILDKALRLLIELSISPEKLVSLNTIVLRDPTRVNGGMLPLCKNGYKINQDSTN